MHLTISKSNLNMLIKSMKENKLEKLKAEIIAILEKKDGKVQDDFKKAVSVFEKEEKHYTYFEKSLSGEWIEKAGYGVGTIRVWKGKKYKKVSSSPTRWVRVFDKHDRGAASSMGKYIAQVKKCSSVEELYQFCMKQRSLFQDDNGVDLPIIDKLRAAIDEQKNSIGKNETVKNTKQEHSITTNMGKKITESELKEKIAEKEEDVKESQRKYDTYLKEEGEKSKYTKQALINLNTDKQSLKRWNNWLDAMKNGDVNEADLNDDGKKKEPEKNIAEENYNDDKAFEEYKKLVVKDNPTKDEVSRIGELVKEHFKHSDKKWPGGAGLKAEKEDTHYWIQDSRGNRLTNESAKKRIKASYDEIDKINAKLDSMDKADQVGAKRDIHDLEYDIKNLMDKLNPDDRKEMETEQEKHKNRSDAMKGNQNAKKYGAIEVSDKDMKLVTGVMQMDNETIDSTIVSYEKEIKERPNGYNVDEYKKRLAIYKNEKEQRKNPLKDIKDNDEIPGIYDKKGLNTISKIADALNMSTDEVRQKVTNRWSNSDWGNDPMKRYLDINDANGKGYAGIPDFSQPLYDNAVTDVVEDYLRDKFSNYIGNDVSDGYVRDCAFDVVNGQMNLKEAENKIKDKSNSSTNTSSNPYVHKKIGSAVEKYATDKKIKATVDKISDEDFTRDPSALVGNPAMNGVFHEDGYKIATDGKILSMIKSDYEDKEEGKVKASPKAIKNMEKTLKVLNKKLTDTETELKAVENKIGRGSHNYELVEQKIYDLQEDISATKNSIESGYVNLGRYGKYPAYKRVIPSFGNAKLETSEGFNDFDNILRVTKVANAYVKSTGSKSTAVKVGNKWFNPENLEKAVAMAKKHGLNEVLFDPNRSNGPIEFKGAKGSVVLMPNMDGAYDTFDVATGNYAAMGIDTEQQMDDFVNNTNVQKSIFDEENFPDLFNNPSENVADALNELFGC